MKGTLTVVLLLVAVQAGFAQEYQRHTFYLEAGGATLFYSLNYDHLFPLNDRTGIATRLGVMYLPTFNASSRTFSGIPVGVSFLKSLRKDFLEIGLTGAVMRDTYWALDQFDQPSSYVNERILMPSVRVGYRHQPVKHLFWNALVQYSVTFVGDADDFSPPEINSLPFISIGIGYSI